MLIDEFRDANNLLVRSFCNLVQPRTIKLTIVGCLKVGKSTLHDRIVRNDHVLTYPVYVICADLALAHYLLT